MDINTVRLALAPLQSAPAASGLKLLTTATGVQLVTSTTRKAGLGAETSFAVMPVLPQPGPSTPFVVLSQLLPPPPGWDMALDRAATRLALVREEAQGAATVLEVIDFDKARATLPPTLDFANYARPRFVGKRSDEATRRVTAILDSREAVLFERVNPGGAYERRHSLCDCVDALVMPYLDGYVLFYKTDMPGPVRGNSTPPGRLHWRALDRQLQPTAAARELFPGLTVFEFSADTAGERVGLLLTTAEGTRFALAEAPAGPWVLSGFVEEGRGEAFSMPSLVLLPQAAHMAVLEAAAGPNARVLFVSAPLKALARR